MILTYHRFSDGPDEFAVSADDFESHLVYLKKHHSVISLDEAVKGFSGAAPLPSNPAVVTIDDGYADAYRTAFPLLKKHGVPATLFVITDFLDGKCWLWTDLMRYALTSTAKERIEVDCGKDLRISKALTSRNARIRIAGSINDYLKTLPEVEKVVRIGEIASELGITLPELPTDEYAPITWDEAREMDSGGVRIESHTVTHPIMTNVDSEAVEKELSESKTVLEERLGREVRHFCYPNGAFDESVRKAVLDSGYESAVTTNYGFCDPGSDLFTLKRIDGQPSLANMAQSASGFESFREKVGI